MEIVEGGKSMTWHPNGSQVLDSYSTSAAESQTWRTRGPSNCTMAMVTWRVPGAKGAPKHTV